MDRQKKLQLANKNQRRNLYHTGKRRYSKIHQITKNKVVGSRPKDGEEQTAENSDARKNILNKEKSEANN